MLFVSASAAGLALNWYQGDAKDRRKRLISKGASTSLLAVGLFGGMFMILSA